VQVLIASSDDEAIRASIRAAQFREEERRRQAKRREDEDRALALQLANGAASGSSSSQPRESDILSHMMQRHAPSSSAPYSSSYSQNQSVDRGSFVTTNGYTTQPSSQPLTNSAAQHGTLQAQVPPPNSQMPGTFPIPSFNSAGLDDFDDDFAGGDDFLHAFDFQPPSTSSNRSRQQPTFGSATPLTNNSANNFRLGNRPFAISNGAGFVDASSRSRPYSVNDTRGSSSPFANGRGLARPPLPNMNSAPSYSRGSINPLAAVIDLTSQYDYERQTNGFGRPLDPRVANYVDDVMNDPRKTSEEIAQLLKNIRPDMNIPVEDREGTPDGLRYPLYPHQQLALTWMKDMEEGTNKGGILADDMGLGKTLSTLALILSRPSNSQRKVKSSPSPHLLNPLASLLP
jgi:hypothetical protein